MSKAYEVMTKSLAIVHPDDSAAHAASIMKERDIGDVLVVENGQLRGIVTDRDLVVHGLAEENDLLKTPISKYMSTDIVTGDADWSLSKVAKTMARHQIRRLPIMQYGQVAGIISLGDIARYYDRKSMVGDSLKNISQPDTITTKMRNRSVGSWLGLSALAVTSALMAWMTWSHNGQQFKKQVIRSKPYYSAAQAVNMAREKVNDAASSKQARNIRKQVKANIKDIYGQLPTIEYKPSKRKFTFFW